MLLLLPTKMNMSRRAVLGLILLCLSPSSSSGDSSTLNILPGDNVILPCYVPNDQSIGAVMWTRSYLNSKYVFFYQSNASDPDTQTSPSLRRIHLLEDGESSLFIVEATFAEIGTYECHVTQRGKNNSKAAILKTKPINTVKLTMEPMKVLVAPGDIAILSCAVPNKESIGAVMWIRSDLNPEKELFYQSNASDPSTQPPHYMNRVRLVNTDMENGELSLFLYDTTFGDDGTYECHVTQVGTSNSKAAILKTTPIKIIKLTVEPVEEEFEVGQSLEACDPSVFFQPLVFAMGIMVVIIGILKYCFGWHKAAPCTANLLVKN
ncbi:uncharacterized protein LOC100691574 isoform X2 [Oreochromis niloticus]|uniref:uncharacterized protein LOC100691574 isoform X2 n=1 Tax=Oreochromis niloticus TaxID=8128 RepID=UPI0009052180|nr:uncharacterized protein LOC100691574 isoform X2 [Oreochromis niloticus]